MIGHDTVLAALSPFAQLFWALSHKRENNCAPDLLPKCLMVWSHPGADFNQEVGKGDSFVFRLCFASNRANILTWAVDPLQRHLNRVLLLLFLHPLLSMLHNPVLREGSDFLCSYSYLTTRQVLIEMGYLKRHNKKSKTLKTRDVYSTCR